MEAIKMAKIFIDVEPGDGTPVGWLLSCFSMKQTNGRLQQTAHKLSWSNPATGKYRAETVNLPNGEYAVHCDVVGAGRSVSITVEGEPPVVFPPESVWPMDVEVAATRTRDVVTWYFQHGGE
jgi:hypothetical protein